LNSEGERGAGPSVYPLAPYGPSFPLIGAITRAFALVEFERFTIVATALMFREPPANVSVSRTSTRDRVKRRHRPLEDRPVHCRGDGHVGLVGAGFAPHRAISRPDSACPFRARRRTQGHLLLPSRSAVNAGAHPQNCCPVFHPGWARGLPLAPSSPFRSRFSANASTRPFEVRIWLRGSDLNGRPSGYEPDELPGCSTPRK
jgi:hypothetical protein